MSNYRYRTDIEYLQEHISRASRDLFHLRDYLVQEGLWEDAEEYLDEHQNDPLPFEIIWSRPIHRHQRSSPEERNNTSAMHQYKSYRGN